MGWIGGSWRTDAMEDKQLNHLIGEALDLGCAGLVCYLVFLSEGPWWANPGSVSQSSAGLPSSSMARPVEEGPQRPVQKRQRHSGCLQFPSSALG